MKEILIAITDVMPKDDEGNIIDKELHSNLISAVQGVEKLNLPGIKVSVCEHKEVAGGTIPCFNRKCMASFNNICNSDCGSYCCARQTKP